jgi:hypothetical protein
MSIDLNRLEEVLDELYPPKNPLSEWKEFENVLDDINESVIIPHDLLVKILYWINKNPHHTYPKKINGWINTITSQFCFRPMALKIVDKMIDKNIITLQTKTCKEKFNVTLNLKRCRENDNMNEFVIPAFKKRKR